MKAIKESGITGVPFGRTYLSICGHGTDIRALLRRDGPPWAWFSRDARQVFFMFCFEQKMTVFLERKSVFVTVSRNLQVA